MLAELEALLRARTVDHSKDDGGMHDMPPFLFSRSFILRSIVLWVVVRLIVAVVALAGSVPPYQVSAWGSVIVVGASLVLGRLDIRVAREDVLLANLGYSLRRIMMIMAIAPCVAEFALALILA